MRAFRTAAAGSIAVLALLAGTAGVAPVLAAGTGDAPGVLSRAVSAPTAEEIRRYWTPRRMREATPVGEAGSASSAVPQIGGAAATRSAESDAQFRATNAGSTRSYPNRVHGKIFFTLPGEGDFVCSGTVVGSPRGNVVVSAAHCAYDDVAKRFATNWEFVPGYEADGPVGSNAPFGEWPAIDLNVPEAWARNGDLRYDVSSAVLAKRGGKTIEERVGARGISFNQDRRQDYRAFGYPSEPPPPQFDGRTLYRCDSPFRGTDPSFSNPSPNRIDCDMTRGSSGGGWVIDNLFVNSVVSYGYILGDPEEMYGPYFGDVAAEVYLLAARGAKCGGLLPTLVGTAAADTIVGTKGRDVILGLGGRDEIRGLGGNDVICAGGADDEVSGGNGDDRIFGERGSDLLIGDLGGDEVRGGGGEDELRGRGGKDRLRGGGSNDRLGGGGGRDRLEGQAGVDVLKGHDGNDRLDGGDGPDRCDGGSGRDSAKRCVSVKRVP